MKKIALLLALMLAFAAVGVPALAEVEYTEAPMLAERVQAGQLPPVEERLPENPRLANDDYPAEQLEYESGV